MKNLHKRLWFRHDNSRDAQRIIRRQCCTLGSLPNLTDFYSNAVNFTMEIVLRPYATPLIRWALFILFMLLLFKINSSFFALFALNFVQYISIDLFVYKYFDKYLVCVCMWTIMTWMMTSLHYFNFDTVASFILLCIESMQKWLWSVFVIL